MCQCEIEERFWHDFQVSDFNNWGMVVLFAEIEETEDDLGNRNQEFYFEFVKI